MDFAKNPGLHPVGPMSVKWVIESIFVCPPHLIGPFTISWMTVVFTHLITNINHMLKPTPNLAPAGK